ncbi:MAG: glycosyltransferase family 4 protein [Chloroflexota bacterium]
MKKRVCIVGAGTRFLSGISYYTLRLANAMAQSHQVSAILMRQLLPTRFYPGRQRVGQELTRLHYAPGIKVFDGVDWHGCPSLLQAIALLWRERPEFVVFQWWTGTVLHLYLLLALAARLAGAKVVIEFHEVLDTGEARMRAVQTYVKTLLPFLIRLASGAVVHSEFDRAALQKLYRLEHCHQALIPLGPFDHHANANTATPLRQAPRACCNLLYFGVIRPFKGVEDLIRAFDSIPEDEIGRYWLTVVGETWEGWTLPAELIAQSRYRDRITFVNRYVHDSEVDAFFAGADAVVLPYHRSSASGPLHITMSQGLPLVVTRVGGLIEAAANYEGAVFVPSQDPDALRQAIDRVHQLQGRRFAGPHSWEQTIARYSKLFAAMERPPAGEQETHYASSAD